MQWLTKLPQAPPVIQVSCDIYDVAPIPPDQVENVILAFRDIVHQVFVSLRYNWTAPDFPGEGITGYQVWLEKEPAPNNQTRGLQLVRPDSRNAETQAVFVTPNGSLALYFQVSM